MVRASCFEVARASVESRKRFLDGSLCLAGHWPWSGCLGSSSWRQRSALLATFRRMWGGLSPPVHTGRALGVAFKQPVIILHVSFRAISTCPVTATSALYREHDVFGLIPHHLENRVRAGDVIQGIYINRQVHEVYIVRTPILQLPPCKICLIRRKMHSVRCEYIISLIQSSL